VRLIILKKYILYYGDMTAYMNHLYIKKIQFVDSFLVDSS
jgi:hypothetical protein